jgi:hypothetical protein
LTNTAASDLCNHARSFSGSNADSTNSAWGLVKIVGLQGIAFVEAALFLYVAMAGPAETPSSSVRISANVTGHFGAS